MNLLSLEPGVLVAGRGFHGFKVMCPRMEVRGFVPKIRKYLGNPGLVGIKWQKPLNMLSVLGSV